MAVLSAVTSFAHIPRGFTGKPLRHGVADSLDPDHAAYGSAQMSYDRRRLRLKSIISKTWPSHWRITRSYRYQLTTYGRKVDLFFTKLDARIFRRVFAAMDASQPVPPPLAAAQQQVEQAIANLVNHARLAPASA